jgi:hypothetical protein
MHATFQQLLSLRDGAPVDAVCKLHVESCERCQRELGQLRDITHALQALPDAPAPTGAWEVVRARLRARGAGTSDRDPAAPSGPSVLPAGQLASQPADCEPVQGVHRPTPARERPGLRQAMLEGMLAGALAIVVVGGLRLWSTSPPGMPRFDATPPAIGQDFLQATAPAGSMAPAMARPARGAPDSASGDAKQLSVAVPAAMRIDASEFDQLLSKIADQDRQLAALRQQGDSAAAVVGRDRVTALKERIAIIDYYCFTRPNLPAAEEYRLLRERVELMDALLAEYSRGDAPSAAPARRQLAF